MKLPPPSVLDVCLRRARLGTYKADFLKLHAALVAALTALQATDDASAVPDASTTATTVVPPQPLQTNGAGVLASALLLHRIILMLVPTILYSHVTAPAAAPANADAASQTTAPGTTPTAVTAATAANVPTTTPTATVTAIGAPTVPTVPTTTLSSHLLEPAIVTDVIAAVQIAELQAPVIVDWTIYQSLHVVLACCATATPSAASPESLSSWLDTQFPLTVAHGVTVAHIRVELTELALHVQHSHVWCRAYYQTLFRPVVAAVDAIQLHLQSDASVVGYATTMAAPAPTLLYGSTKLVAPPRALLGGCHANLVATSAAQQRNKRIQTIQRLKDVAWKLALSECLAYRSTDETTTLYGSTSTSATAAASTRLLQTVPRHVVIQAFAAALGTVVTLCGNEPWVKPDPSGTVKPNTLGDAELQDVPVKKKLKTDASTAATNATNAATTTANDVDDNLGGNGPASAVVRAILVEANHLLQEGCSGSDTVVESMTEEALRTEMIRLAQIVKAATDEQRVSLAPLTVIRHASRKPAATSTGTSIKPAPRALTFLQVLLGVATCEKLTWYLPTFATILYRRALSKLHPPMPAHALPDGTNRTRSSRRYCPWYVDFAYLLIGETAAYLGTAPTPSLADVCAAALDPAAVTAAAAAVAQPPPRTVTPVIISEAMELNEWAVSVTFLEVVKPSLKLRTLLDDLSGETNTSSTAAKKWHTIVLTVVNKALLRLSQEHVAERPPRKAPVAVSLAIPTIGTVQVHGDLTPDKQLCKAVVAFYYHALEAILYVEKVRLDRVDEADTKVKSSHLVLNDVFHGALFTCCCSSVTKAIGFTQKLNPSPLISRLQIYSILHVTGISPFEFLKVVETFLDALCVDSPARDHLGSPLIFTLPRMLQKDIRQVEVNTMDSLVWARNSAITSDSITDKILEFQDKMANKQNDDVCLWPPLELAPTLPEELQEDGVEEFVVPDYPDVDHEEYSSFRSVAYVLRKLLFLVHQRITTLCSYLQISEDVPVVLQVWKTFRYLMRHHIDLLFDRHVDHWVLCCIYAVCRTITYEPEVKFGKIIEAYVAFREPDLGSVTCQRIVRHIKLAPGKTTEEGMGNVITLYNKVFVPAMKDFLLNSPSLKACAEKLASIRAGEDTTVRAVEPTPGVVVHVGGTTTAFDAPPASAVVTFGKLNEEAVAVANAFSKDEEGHAMVVD